MADRRTHARCEAPRHAADLRADVVGHMLIKTLQRVIADVVTVFRAETGNRIGITDFFQAFCKQQNPGTDAVDQPAGWSTASVPGFCCLQKAWKKSVMPIRLPVSARNTVTTSAITR